MIDYYIISDGNAHPVYKAEQWAPLGFVIPPVRMAPDPELPEPPRWYRGTRMQWQADASALAIAYAAEQHAFDRNADLHARREPDQRYYGQHGTYTTCKCWNCRGGSPEAIALREAKQRTREAEQAAYARTATGDPNA